jgi:integrase
VHLTVVAADLAAEQLAARDGGRFEHIFPSPTGTMWRKDNFMARVFRPAVRRAGLEGLTFHDLPAYLRVADGRGGVTPHLIAEQLGHRDARLVLLRYGHLYPGPLGRLLWISTSISGPLLWARRGEDAADRRAFRRKPCK